MFATTSYTMSQCLPLCDYAFNLTKHSGRACLRLTFSYTARISRYNTFSTTFLLRHDNSPTPATAQGLQAAWVGSWYVMTVDSMPYLPFHRQLSSSAA